MLRWGLRRTWGGFGPYHVHVYGDMHATSSTPTYGYIHGYLKVPSKYSENITLVNGMKLLNVDH
jgi:hypothetical protein